MKDTTDSRAAYNSQDAVEATGNRYLLPLIAAQRFRELRAGDVSRVKTNAGPKITALQEIEAGCFHFQKFTGKYAK